MMRLFATLALDVRQQFRNGFYYAALFVSGLAIIILFQFRDYEISRFIPIFIVMNMLVSTFYFIAGLILLERDESTLSAQIVTPLRTNEYFAAKLISLGGLAVVENSLVIIIPFGIHFNLPIFLLGLILASAFYVLAGIIVVIRHHSINEFMIPAIFYTLLFAIPVLQISDFFPGWLFVWHPLNAIYFVINAAIEFDWLQFSLNLTISIIWLGILWVWAQRRFVKFVRQEGGM